MAIGVPASARAGSCGPTCSDVCVGGGCDFDTPKACAIGVANGETCLVRGGTYYETVTFQTTPTTILRTGLNFVCENPTVEPCVIDGESTLENGFLSYTDWVIDGFEIRNTLGAAIDSQSSREWIGVRNCYIHDVGGPGLTDARAGAIIENNRIENVWGDGIACETGTGVTVRNNLVLNYAVGGGARGIYCTFGGANVIEHNTVVSAPVGSSSAATTGIESNIIRYNVVEGGLKSIRATVESGYNLVFGATTAYDTPYPGPGTGDLEQDPLFLGPEDFRLDSASPAIDAALTSAEALDLLGQPRSSPDQGAYEYQVTDTTIPPIWAARDEIFDPTGLPDSDAVPDLVFVPGYGPAMAYHDSGSSSVRFAYRDGAGLWQHQEVQAGVTLQLNDDVFRRGVSLAVDPTTGQPSIAWAERVGSSVEVKVAAYHGATCGTGDCSGTNWLGCGEASIPLGVAGVNIRHERHPISGDPVVAVARNSSGCESVTYYQRQAGIWSAVVVEAAAPCGTHLGYGMDLGFHPLSGEAEIAYTRAPSTSNYGELMVATGGLAGFFTVSVPLGAGVTTTTASQTQVALAHSSSGTLGVAFSEDRVSLGADRGLGIGFVERVSMSWGPGAETVDHIGFAGAMQEEGIGLAYDTGGNPWLGYSRAASVRQARRLGGLWEVELVDAARTTGRWAAFALSDTDVPALAYQRTLPDKKVLFASQAGIGGWASVPTFDPCDDHSVCTTDACGAGVCTNTPITCDDSDACTANTCDPVTGCGYPSITCDDGDLCTTDGCDPGTGCTATPVSCDDGDDCTANQCEPSTGACTFPPISCDDGDPCTVDRCDIGTGCDNTPAVCEDFDLCTADACNPTTGVCEFTATVTCDDGDPCTVDGCNPGTGVCEAPTKDCSDGQLCTDDVCEAATGNCLNPALVCDDGDLCTVDACDPGSGLCAAPPVDCDDGQPCTADGCDATGACFHQPMSGVACDDGDPGTQGDACYSGTCLGYTSTVTITRIESVGVSDQPAVYPPVVITRIESVGVSDLPAVHPPVVITLTESVGVRDAPGSEVTDPPRREPGEKKGCATATTPESGSGWLLLGLGLLGLGATRRRRA